MGIAGYEIRYGRGSFAKLENALQKNISGSSGAVLVPVSSVSALLPIDLHKIIAQRIGDVAFNALLQGNGANIASTIDERRYLALCENREPEDLPARSKSNPSPINGYDWQLDLIQAPQAWTKHFGNPAKIDWKDVKVGHIDTGYTTHQALGFVPRSQSWVNTVRGRNFRRLGFGDGDVSEPPTEDVRSARDPLSGAFGGHGTRTMSVICGMDVSEADSETNYKGFFGVAPRVPLFPVRVSDTVWIADILESSLPDALQYLTKDVGAGVISMSMGTPVMPFPFANRIPKRLRRAIDNAYENGVIFICAAGNGIPNKDVIFPARNNRTFACAGVASDKTPWTGSSYGAMADLAAPAYQVKRANTKRSGHFDYALGEGTSYATALIAGAAALWLAKYPNEIKAKYPEPWQRVEAFRVIATENATKHLDSTPSGQYGAGILNVLKLLDAPLPEASRLTMQPGA
jgi:subtilisin family serine protease